MSTPDGGRGLAEWLDPAVWAAWFAGLDRGFAFLLLLPFIVAAVALWASYVRGDDPQGAEPEQDREDR